MQLNEFVIGVLPGRNLRRDLRRIDLNADFLMRFADRGAGVAFPRIEVPSGAAVPFQRRHVFEVRTLLEVNVPALVDDKNVDSAMQQLALVDLATRELTDDLVALIHHIEHLAGLLPRIGLVALLVVAGDLNPLRERQRLRPHCRRDIERLNQRLPTARSLGQEIFELLAPLGEAHAHQPIKQHMIKHRQCGRITRREADDGGIHPRLRIKHLRRHHTQQLHIPILLHQQAQRPVGVVLASGRETVADLLLQHEHRAAHRCRRCQPVLQDLTAHRVRQIAHQPQRPMPKPRPQVDARGVVVDDLHILALFKLADELRCELRVFFDQDELLRPAHEMLRQRPHPWTDLHHHLRPIRLHLIPDPPGRLLILEEILPHALAGREVRSWGW